MSRLLGLQLRGQSAAGFAGRQQRAAGVGEEERLQGGAAPLAGRRAGPALRVRGHRAMEGLPGAARLPLNLLWIAAPALGGCARVTGCGVGRLPARPRPLPRCWALADSAGWLTSS